MSITIRKTLPFGVSGLTPTCSVTPSSGVSIGTVTELGSSGCYFVDITVPSIANYAVLAYDGVSTPPDGYMVDEITQQMLISDYPLKSDLETKSDFQEGLATESSISGIATQLGTAGAGLTAIGDARLANLDASVSSRLAGAAYTSPQPELTLTDGGDPPVSHTLTFAGYLKGKEYYGDAADAWHVWWDGTNTWYAGGGSPGHFDPKSDAEWSRFDASPIGDYVNLEGDDEPGATLAGVYPMKGMAPADVPALNASAATGVFPAPVVANAGGLSEQDAAKLNTILTQALLISSGKLSIINPFLAGKVLVIVKDDDYLADKDRTITIPPDVWIDPTGANIKLHCLDLESEKDIVIIDGSADAEKERYNFNPSQAQTSLLKRTGIGHYQWAVKYHYDAGMFTILLGPLIVK